MTPTLPHNNEVVRVLWRWASDTPNAVSRARTALRCALDQLGYGGETLDDAVLAVSELASNALEHAPGPYEVRLRFTASGLICEVADRAPQLPAVPAFPATGPFEVDPSRRGGGRDALLKAISEGGRGLHVVHQLTSGAWGFAAEEGGRMKVAWMAIPGR
ncbi:ATP-binding protein [Streptomyces endophytica]|uniref:ATP-binding protein n=1 Tax=Streptomyces endophytica TaxID=2991496 RepID=A0ABY6PHX9_9ACTN|nr:ATP-binding protein [Streptomyces endophytica]UZJ33488.1 ATP-binding protein [Streptomyces endophytica]